MADESLEAHIRRLAALIAPLAESVRDHDARLAKHEAIIERLDRIIARLYGDEPNGR